MQVVFSNRAYASVLAETTEKIKTETGGLFLGTILDDTWYIIEAIDPGPKSVFEIAYFEYDRQYTQHLINKIANLYDKRLSLVGLWHRHPGSFDQFSSTDDGTNTKYAAMRCEGAISALVNLDPDFRITMYHVGRPCRYKKIEYKVGDDFIPCDLFAYKTPERYFSIMERLLKRSDVPDMTKNEYHKSVSLSSFMKFIMSELEVTEYSDAEAGNLADDESLRDKITEAVVPDITFMADSVGVEVSVSLCDKYLTVFQEAVDKTDKIYFMYSVPKQEILFSYNNKCYMYRQGLFAEAFGRIKAEKQHQEQNETQRRNNGIINSVIKIIAHGRNEE